MSSMKRETKKSIIGAIAGWLLSLMVIGPVYIIVINSFKTRGQIFSDQLGWPEIFSFEFYSAAAKQMSYLNSLKNSLLIVGISVVFIVLIASMAAWALARRNTGGSRLLFYMFLATMLIPFQAVMIPLIQYFNSWRIGSGDFAFRMIDSRYGLIFMNIGFGMSLSIFLYHGFVKSVPLEMEESARIDGCNQWMTFWRVVFPNLLPITVTVAILNVINYWNDYLLPSLVLRKPALRTIPLSTFFFFGEFNIQWNLALAGLVMTIIPVIIFYLLAQRYIISGVMAGAVKG